MMYQSCCHGRLVREVKHAEALLAELSGNAASGKGVRDIRSNFIAPWAAGNRNTVSQEVPCCKHPAAAIGGLLNAAQASALSACEEAHSVTWCASRRRWRMLMLTGRRWRCQR